MNEKILLIDDDQSLLRVTEYNLVAAGFEVQTADSGTRGLELFAQISPGLVITDVKLGDMSGLDVLGKIKEIRPDIPVIVITAFGSIEIAVKAMKCGAFNFLTKPFERETLHQICRKALDVGELQSQNRFLLAEVGRLAGLSELKSHNPAMAHILETALRAAGSTASILIDGESGTGKEVLARLIHQHSARSEKPMVAVNCAALPPSLIESELFGHVRGAFTGAESNRLGRFQTASGGTLFLDEIAELPIDLQAKLLRTIQEKEVQPVGSDVVEKVDVRLITATNKDLKQEIDQGSFREDLFYRLGVIHLSLPPLRERPEDIIMFAKYFLVKLQAPLTVSFTDGALDAMQRHRWPGNIRELQNVVERALILRRTESIDTPDLQLPETDHRKNTIDLPPEGIDLSEVERTLIIKALIRTGGNRSEASRLLHIPRHVLIYRLEKYKIDTESLEKNLPIP